MKHYYRIVEKSGTDSEFVTGRRFESLDKAEKALNRHYTQFEKESLPVLIALERPDGSLTYEY